MAQRQIFRQGERLGFLPWGTPGYRLGAARWTDLFLKDSTTFPGQIEIANTETSQIPSIPYLFRNNTTFILPETTIRGNFTIPQPITWCIDAGDSDSHIRDGQLSVIGSEGSHFVLSAEVNETKAETFRCQIEEKERVQLNPITVNVKPLSGYGRDGKCEFICNTEQWFNSHYEDDLQTVVLQIGEETYGPTNKKLSARNRTMNFGSLFTIHLSKFPLNSDEGGEVKWHTNKQVFIAEVTFDYTRLKLESLSFTGHFKPHEIALSELYLGDKSETIASLDLGIGNNIHHGWPISLRITTPTASKLIEFGIEKQITLPIKREKIQEWFNSPSENKYHRLITMTPCITGKEVSGLTTNVQINLVIPQAPSFGLRGSKTVEWTQFLLRTQADYNTIQQQHGIQNIFADEEWIKEISPEKLSSINRNNIYRSICQQFDFTPLTNSDRVTELLSQHCIYHEKEIEVKYNPGKALKELYGDKKELDIKSPEIQILYPRQKFRLVVDGTEIPSGPNGAISYYQGNIVNPVLDSNGMRYTKKNTVFNHSQLLQSFAYRENSGAFAAPQTPGLYYLYVPSKGEHYLLEIEVHCFTEEVVK